MRCRDGFWSPFLQTLCGCCPAEPRLCTSSRWEEGHIEEWSQISFPDGIVEWAESEFRRVKAKQVSTILRDSLRAPDHWSAEHLHPLQSHGRQTSHVEPFTLQLNLQRGYRGTSEIAPK